MHLIFVLYKTQFVTNEDFTQNEMSMHDKIPHDQDKFYFELKTTNMGQVT